ncbi:MAG: type I restriction-modification system subunit M [Actinomycetota bacterium]|nr:type I restriction-modification system subunit M [Actinomycetota bacterium]
MAGRKRAETKEPLGFEQTLWAAADKLRGNLESAEYKHVVLGLIFLKYVSDAFEERREFLEVATADPASDYYVKNEKAREQILEARDEYTSEGVFWVPAEARWGSLQASAKQVDIGQRIDRAMDAIEAENPSLKGVLPKSYSRPAIDKRRLGELIDLIGTIGLGSAEHRERDILGRVYEYFLGRFAAQEGKGGGEFYTPSCVVQVLVEMLEPYSGRVYDPCCGSGGMFVQSVKFTEAHGGKRNELSVYGQELNDATWRLAKMNLAIRGIESNLGDRAADTFHSDLHPDLRADFILANPPFNISDWGGAALRDDPRWRYGTPPANNANYAWVQHMVHHLAPHGVAGFVLANGSMSTQTSGEGEIRKSLVDAGLVDCMVALPTQLFYSTGIPVCLWFLARDRTNQHFRDRSNEVLFIDARNLGTMVDRTHRELTGDDVARIARTYHAWRGETEAGDYKHVAGFCKSAKLDEIAAHGYVLTPGRYVGAEDTEDDDEPFDKKLERLRAALLADFDESDRLEQLIRSRLEAFSNGADG